MRNIFLFVLWFGATYIKGFAVFTEDAVDVYLPHYALAGKELLLVCNLYSAEFLA